MSAASWLRAGSGFGPLCAFVDHGAAGTGEPVQLMLRPGDAGSNPAADHIAGIHKGLAQLTDTHPVSGRDGRC